MLLSVPPPQGPPPPHRLPPPSGDALTARKALSELAVTLGRPLRPNEDRALMENRCEVVLEDQPEVFKVLRTVLFERFLKKERQAALSGRILLGISYSAAAIFLPGLWRILQHMLPRVIVVPKFSSDRGTAQLYRTKQVDIALYFQKGEEEIPAKEDSLYQGHYQLFVSRNWHGGRPQLFVSADCLETKAIRDYLVTILERYPWTMVELSSFAWVKTMVESGLGVGLLPDFLEHQTSLVVYSRQAPLAYQLVCQSPTKGPNRALCQSIRSYLAGLVPAVKKHEPTAQHVGD